MKVPSQYPKLNLPPCRLRISDDEGCLRVWDPLRKKYLLLTPEEWVRRHVMALLGDRAGVPQHNICQEYPVSIGGMCQRADIVVVGRDGKPLMLVECKAPDVKVTQDTLEQAFRYNSVLGSRYVMLTNGMDHYIYENSEGNCSALDAFPDLSAFFG